MPRLGLSHNFGHKKTKRNGHELSYEYCLCASCNSAKSQMRCAVIQRADTYRGRGDNSQVYWPSVHHHKELSSHTPLEQSPPSKISVALSRIKCLSRRRSCLAMPLMTAGVFGANAVGKEHSHHEMEKQCSFLALHALECSPASASSRG